MRDVLTLSTGPALPEHEIEIEIDAIDVEDRLRIVDRDKVAMFAASISESYLHQAIAVATTPGAGNRYVLVDGEHRLEAHKLLGRKAIKAVIRDLTPAERLKHEIHANLIRNELDALDRTRFIGRLADIFEAENADARHGGDRKSRKWREKNQLANLATWSGFNKEAASRTGLAESSVRKARALAAALCPEAVALIQGTKLASNQSQLKALAKLPEDQQLAVARAVSAQPALALAAARVAAGLAPTGGAVRETDRPLAKLEPIIFRLSLEQLHGLGAMVAARIAALTPSAKPKTAKRGADA